MSASLFAQIGAFKLREATPGEADKVGQAVAKCVYDNRVKPSLGNESGFELYRYQYHDKLQEEEPIMKELTIQYQSAVKNFTHGLGQEATHGFLAMYCDDMQSGLEVRGFALYTNSDELDGKYHGWYLPSLTADTKGATEQDIKDFGSKVRGFVNSKAKELKVSDDRRFVLKGPIVHEVSGRDDHEHMIRMLLYHAMLKYKKSFQYSVVTPSEKEQLEKDWGVPGKWTVAKELDGTKEAKETGELLLSAESDVKLFVMWRHVT